jgi:hypothetical protein
MEKYAMPGPIVDDMKMFSYRRERESCGVTSTRL